MADDSSRFVPKVHPATRGVEAEDPMELCATAVEGDPEVLFRAVVQEYAWMGWDQEQIAALFRDPFYPLLYGLWHALGEDETRRRLDEAFRRFGVVRFRATIEEAPEEVEPDLVQISSPSLRPSAGNALNAGHARPEGSNHAQRV